MSDLSVLFTISERSHLQSFIETYEKYNVDVSFISLGRGTARTEAMEYFGLSQTEKAVCVSVVSDSTWKKIRKDLINEGKIDVPGRGVLFLVPMSSIGGRRELNFFTDGQEFTTGDESVMKGTDKELLIAICNQGHTETVMNAARAAGAGGGTIVHARGTGMKKTEQFLGVTLASEKEIVYIVAKTKIKNDIMQSIMKNAGTKTEAKTIVFSLPVTDTLGIKFKEE